MCLKERDRFVKKDILIFINLIYGKLKSCNHFTKIICADGTSENIDC